MCLAGLSVWSMGVGNKVRVGVFQGNGGAQTCIWETIASIQLDPDMTVRTITTGDIANGVLKDLKDGQQVLIYDFSTKDPNRAGFRNVASISGRVLLWISPCC